MAFGKKRRRSTRYKRSRGSRGPSSRAWRGGTMVKKVGKLFKVRSAITGKFFKRGYKSLAAAKRRAATSKRRSRRKR